MALIADLMKGAKPAGKPMMGKSAGSMPDMEEEEGGADLRAAEDLISATQGGDATGVVAAFKRMMACCGGDEEESEGTVSDTGAKRIVE